MRVEPHATLREVPNVSLAYSSFVRYAAWSQQFRLTERGIHPVSLDENAAAAVVTKGSSRD
jgi:hypothetical protein